MCLLAGAKQWTQWNELVSKLNLNELNTAVWLCLGMSSAYSVAL